MFIGMLLVLRPNCLDAMFEARAVCCKSDRSPKTGLETLVGLAAWPGGRRQFTDEAPDRR
jgi:hypothetical protein